MYFYRFFLLMNPVAPSLDLDSNRLYNISQQPPLIPQPLRFMYPRLGVVTPSGILTIPAMISPPIFEHPSRSGNKVFMNLSTDSQSLIFFLTARASSGPTSAPLHSLWRFVSG